MAKRQLLITVQGDSHYQTPLGCSGCTRTNGNWCSVFGEKLYWNDWSFELQRCPACLAAESAVRDLREQARAEVVDEMARLGVDFSKVQR